MYFGFQNVSVRYGKKTILSQLSLEVPKGKIMTLIGQNGCGKSTLLKMILGEVEPDAGTISIGETVKIGYFPRILRYGIQTSGS